MISMRMQSGQAFEPILIRQDANHYLVIDGRHRLAASQSLGHSHASVAPLVRLRYTSA
jgi:ParB-like chromosome segregation protein Spo0J